jgi:catechol 2,3-dioxygenase
VSFGVRPPGFRLPESTQVGAVHLQIADLSRSLAYYGEVLGLGVLDRSRQEATLGTDRALVHLQARVGAKPVPRRGAYGLFHFAILLPDRAALSRFAAHLGRLGLRAGMADHLVSEALYLSDPDGLGIEVYSDRPRSTWRQQGQELAMTTDPLDLEDLLAAGGTPWSGMPAGTTMGHVHLHVGELDAAATFYHRALGLDMTVWSYPGALFFSAGGYHHHLGTNTWSPGPAAAENQARLLHWELLLPAQADLRAAAESLLASGYRADRDMQALVTVDPWGTSLRLTPRA